MGLPHKESTFSDEDGFEDEDLSDLNEEAVYNRDGLEEKLQDIGWPENAGWIHKLTIDIDQEQEVDVNDDLKREASFYTQALEGTRQAFEKLQSMGLPFLRPADYYAEMVKSDAHMEKVKCLLLSEQKEIEEAEERKKAREAKKLAKEIQVQKTKERVKQKKEEIESVKKWRKQRQQSGFAGEVDNGELDLAFEGGKSFDRSNKKRPGVSPGDRSGGKARKSGGGDGGKGKRKKNRDFRNSKFGFGGKKSMKKQNTTDTTDDLRGFSKGDGVGNKRRKSHSKHTDLQYDQQETSQFDWPGGPFESSSREDVLLSKDKVLEPCMGFKEAELPPGKIAEDVTIGFIPRYPPLISSAESTLTDMGVTIGASSVLCFCCFCTSRLKSTSDNVVKLI
ncbi:rrna-processing protein ebp2-related [Citrus sinensis]|nr:rrna-processing protein ebp2-related [Citrus sinensis]